MTKGSANPSAKAALLAEMARAAPGPEPSFEQALGELEGLVAAMEGQQLPLDQLLQGYQRGAELLRVCRAQLQAVEQQVKLLDGGELKPWEDS